MKRICKGSRLLVALLVGAMTLSAAKMPVTATEDQEEHEYLPPENPRWDDEGNGIVDIPDTTTGYVVGTMYKIEDGVKRTIASYGFPCEANPTRSFPFFIHINESGTYVFKAKMSAADTNGSGNMSTGAVSVDSEPFVYEKPATKLATPENIRWSSEKPNVAEWDPVENALGYRVLIYRDGIQIGSSSVFAGQTSSDQSFRMKDMGDEKYTFCVSALSGELKVCAHSDFSEISAEYRKKDLEWGTVDGKSYWYENNVKQGTVNDPKGVYGDGTNRGREICDMGQQDDTGQQGVWFWLDSVYDGAKAEGKEVWIPYIYQNEDDWGDARKREVANESDAGMADLVYDYMKNKTGKWVRYDENGRMLKGWVKIEGALAEAYPDQVGNVYYYDSRTGLMAKGVVTIQGVEHEFDETTGVLIR